MTHPQTESCPGTESPIEWSANADTRHALSETLWEQVCRRLSGGARGLKVDVCHDSATVVLAGVVNSFYAKQVLYQVCRRWTPGFRVIDTTVVGGLPSHRG